MDNKTEIKTEYKVGDEVIITDGRIDTSSDDNRSWGCNTHTKRNILKNGKLGQEKRGYGNGIQYTNCVGRIINILPLSESDNGNCYVVGFDTLDLDFYNKDKFKNHTKFTRIVKDYDTDEDVTKEYVYTSGCMLNTTNFIGKGSVEDFERQLKKVMEEMVDEEMSIQHSRNQITELNKQKIVLEDKIKEVQ